MQTVKQISEQIISICNTPYTALQAIHLMMRHGGASQLAWQTLYHRVMSDDDVDGAYYLASFAQKIDDLPFEVLPLVSLVLTKGDENMRLALLDKLPEDGKTQLKALGILD